MIDIIGPHAISYSFGRPLDSFLEHLRHLAKPPTSRQILRKRFGMGGTLLDSQSRLLSAHVEQALAFFHAGLVSDRRVRPVLQYYAFLNFAVAAIHAYRPQGHQGYRNHGLQDLSSSITRLSLNSKLVSTKANRPGAIGLFNAIISGATLGSYRYSLRELLPNIPQISAELEDGFGIRIAPMGIRFNIAGTQAPKQFRLQIQLVCNSEYLMALRPPRRRFPDSAVRQAIPILDDQFACSHTSATSSLYITKSKFTSIKKVHEFALRNKDLLTTLNFGGHLVHDDCEIEPQWYYTSSSQLLPTLTSTLMVLFAYASIVRYRPNLVQKMQSHRLSLLFDTLLSESPFFFIPAIRNLLYREHLIMSQTPTG